MKLRFDYYLYMFKYTVLKSVYRHTVKPVILPIIKRRNLHRINSTMEEIKKFKNIGKGGRCFVIGNGPSLTAKDLDKLKNEICFGTNRIYEIFSETDWRPTYYCALDNEVINKSKSKINKEISSKKFIGLIDHVICPSVDDATYIRVISCDNYSEMPKFSDNAEKYVYAGSTVTYACIQLAVYMGFKEIILLGVDHNYSVYIDENGNFFRQDGVQDHFSEKAGINGIGRLSHMTLGYQAARKYADEHNIKIYNATRGGKLEVFERVEFDSLFKSKGDN